MFEAKTIYQEVISHNYPNAFSTENSELFRFSDEEKSWLIKIYKENSKQISAVSGALCQKGTNLS